MYWRKLLFYLFVWIATEIIFNLLEIDNLADYGEFILSKNLVVSESNLLY